MFSLKFLGGKSARGRRKYISLTHALRFTAVMLLSRENHPILFYLILKERGKITFPVFEGELGAVLGHLGSVGSRQGFS